MEKSLHLETPVNPQLIGDRLTALTQELPPSVKLVVVSKYVSADTIRIAYEWGIRDFGESRVQTAQEKQEALQDLPDLSWHLIGSLQTNKAKSAIAMFDWIHSVDRLTLAQHLDRLIEAGGKSPKLCLQVKPEFDPSKSGWSEHALYHDLAALGNCGNLNILGLMTILPIGLDQSQSYELFEKVATIKTNLQSKWNNLDQLSMGMSGDYQAAIKAGATMVRIGSQIFR
jgi:PLP dependent protein